MLCSSSSDEVKVTAGPHGTAEVGLRLKTLCARACKDGTCIQKHGASKEN